MYKVLLKPWQRHFKIDAEGNQGVNVAPLKGRCYQSNLIFPLREASDAVVGFNVVRPTPR